MVPRKQTSREILVRSDLDPAQVDVANGISAKRNPYGAVDHSSQ